MTCTICKAEHAEGDLTACRAALRERLKRTKLRAKALNDGRVNSKKDQAGVAASEAFMKEHGLSRYSERETSATLANRVTQPITLEHYQAVLAGLKCLECNALIRCVQRPNGGSFWVCASDPVKGCGWYASFDAAKGTGTQVVLTKNMEAA